MKVHPKTHKICLYYNMCAVLSKSSDNLWVIAVFFIITVRCQADVPGGNLRHKA